MTDRYFSSAARTTVIEIFEIGASEYCMQIVRDASIIGLGNMADKIADHFGVNADQIEVMDVYWGGEHADENCIAAVTIDRRIVATFGRAITHSEALAIALNEANDVAYIAEGTI